MAVNERPSRSERHPAGNFAFYDGVSTEDQQDPTSSKGWQVARANQIIEPSGGLIVKEFFEIDQSRSVPWKRRPQAVALLETFKARRLDRHPVRR